MRTNIPATRAEIYELARLLRQLGDKEGAKHVVEALVISEDASVLTALDRLEKAQKGKMP